MRATIIYLLVLFGNQVHGQEYQMKWDLSLGTVEDDKLYDVISTRDNNFLFAAGTKDAFGYSDYYIIKTDETGAVEWERTYGADDFDFLSSVVESEDGGFLLGGYSKSFPSTPFMSNVYSDFWVIKVDKLGQIEWEKLYGGSKSDVLRSMIANDRGYLLVGSTSSNDRDVSVHRGKTDAWAVQIDQFRNIIWERSFGGSEAETFNAVLVMEDQNILFAGITESHDGMISNNYGFSDGWVVCTDPNGELLWEKTFGGSYPERIGYKNIKQAKDGNYILYGASASSDHDLKNYSGQENAWVWKINKQGDLLWSYAVGHEYNETINDVKELEDNKLLLFGWRATLSDPFAAANYWLVVIDERDGSILNDQMFGGIPDDFGISLIENKEEEIILTGFSNSNDGDVTHKVGMQDIWLACIELKSTKTRGMAADQIIKVRPNPAHDFINIELSDNFEVVANIYDINGKLVLGKIKDTLINLEDFNTGLYILEIQDLNSKSRWTTRIIKK